MLLAIGLLLFVLVGCSETHTAVNDRDTGAHAQPKAETIADREPTFFHDAPSATEEEGLIVYVAPARYETKYRIEGNVRGNLSSHFALRVLTPEGLGLTTSDQPTLYWFTAQRVPYPVEVLIADKVSPDPLLELHVSQGTPAGIHKVALAEHGVRLAPGIDYRWSVAIVIDPANRSKDVVATGAVRHIDEGPPLARQLEAAPADATPRVYAANGVWYEALDALSKLIEAYPENDTFRQMRASLLEQVALPEVAAYEQSRSHVSTR